MLFPSTHEIGQILERISTTSPRIIRSSYPVQIPNDKTDDKGLTDVHQIRQSLDVHRKEPLDSGRELENSVRMGKMD